MSAQSFETGSRASRARVAPGGLGKYQLEVTAGDVADVVRCAGGWLFDRAMAGCDVTVVLTDGGDARPLEILGLSTHRQEPDDDSAAPRRGIALAVSSAAVATDPQLGDDVLRALKRGLTEVTLWGGDWPSGPELGTEPVEHQLSAAARAFKAQALAALGSAEPVGAVETFRHRSTPVLSNYSDLTPSAASSLAHR